MALDRILLVTQHAVTEESCAQFGWSALEAIFDDHVNRLERLEDALAFLERRVRSFGGVHSTRGRVKNPYHLLAKCLRKVADDPNRVVTADTYRTEITDLIGVRVLHLFKDEWKPIDCEIRNNWEPIEKPIAYHRKGDDAWIIQQFADGGCDLKEHKLGYRSVHYLVAMEPTRERCVAEIQVRTIFEEGWSEVDHKIRYPFVVDPALEKSLVLLNRLAGAADEMASAVAQWVGRLQEIERDNSVALEERDRLVKILQAQVDELKVDASDKQAIIDNIRELSARKTADASTQMIRLIFGRSAMIAGGVIGQHGAVGVARRPFEEGAASALRAFRVDPASFPTGPTVSSASAATADIVAPGGKVATKPPGGTEK